MLLLTVCSLGQCQKEKQNIPVHHVFSAEMAHVLHEECPMLGCY